MTIAALHASEETGEHVGQQSVPLVPIVAPRAGVELQLKTMLGQQCGKLAVGWEETFLFSAGGKNIGDLSWIDLTRENERIVVKPRLTSPRAKN